MEARQALWLILVAGACLCGAARTEQVHLVHIAHVNDGKNAYITIILVNTKLLGPKSRLAMTTAGWLAETILDSLGPHACMRAPKIRAWFTSFLDGLIALPPFVTRAGLWTANCGSGLCSPSPLWQKVQFIGPFTAFSRCNLFKFTPSGKSRRLPQCHFSTKSAT